MKYLSVTLKLMSLYMMFVGVFALFFQSAGAFLFLFKVTDPILMRAWGVTLITLALFYLMISYDVQKYRTLIWVGVVHLSISFFNTLYHIGTKQTTTLESISIGVFFIPVFLIVLLTGILHKPKEEVVFEIRDSGKKLKEVPRNLPEHVREKHPLHGK